MILYFDKKFKFYEIFNPTNGLLIRSNCKKSKKNPTLRAFPELLDVGIMGNCHNSINKICEKAGIACYQNGIVCKQDDMNLKNYKKILKQSYHKVFQIALGGRGDPNKHKFFKEFLYETRKADIIPNLTTSGVDLSDDEVLNIKKYCGAVAVSHYSRMRKYHGKYIETSEYTNIAVQKLLDAKCITNIHFVLSKKTIKEAIERLKYNLFPKGINAIIFILYKNVGSANSTDIINISQFKKLLEYIQNKTFDFKIGFDTCCTPMIMNIKNNIVKESIDSCEAARFSMYIDSNLNAYPCSFDIGNSLFKESVKNKTIEDVWFSKTFNNFRKQQEKSCHNCMNKVLCFSRCILNTGINNICDRGI